MSLIQTIRATLNAVHEHMKRVGECSILEVHDAVTRENADAICRANQVEIPEAVRSVYEDFGNGFELNWTYSNDEFEWQGRFAWPELKAFVQDQVDWTEYLRWLDNEPDELAVDNKALAREILSRMDDWMPFCTLCNGDLFCIDRRSGGIVFHQHDWHDGGTGMNGWNVADNLETFITNWGSVCFSEPIRDWPFQRDRMWNRACFYPQLYLDAVR